MANITKEEIIRLAHMSMISIYEQETLIPKLVERLDGVLNYASRLIELVKDQNLEGMPHNINISRYDDIMRTNFREILALAPKCEENYFVVPKILST